MSRRGTPAINIGNIRNLYVGLAFNELYIDWNTPQNLRGYLVKELY